MQIAFIEDLKFPCPFSRISSCNLKLYFPFDLTLNELSAFASTCMSNYFGFIALLKIYFHCPFSRT